MNGIVGMIKPAPQSLNRRAFLQSAGAAAVSLGWSGEAPKWTKGAPNAEALGWRVGVQVWTFHKWTLFEALEMTASLGLKYVETFEGQQVSKQDAMPFGSDTPREVRERLKARLKTLGLVHTSHYHSMRNLKRVAPTFSFCRDLGLEMLITDPHRVPEGEGGMDFYEKVAKEYGVRMVLTNHPKASPYWNPAYVEEDCKGRGKWVSGSCDVGHYMRGGFEPLAVVKGLVRIGKMEQFHFRDVDKRDPSGRDVPLGQGTADIRGILEHLHASGVKPLIMLEYERNFDHPMDSLVPSLEYLDRISGEILRKNGTVEP